MADYYVDSILGTDGGAEDGTAAHPYLNIAQAVGLAGAGAADDDTIYLHSTMAVPFREQLQIVAAGQRVTIKSWVGKAGGDGVLGAYIDGSTNVPLASWAGAAGVFTKTLPAGTCDLKNSRTLPEGIATVTINWATQTDASSRHYGHLQRASSAANCAATANTWWFEPLGVAGSSQDGSGTLTINLSAAPYSLTTTGTLVASGLVIDYVVGNRNGVEIGTPTYTDHSFTTGDSTALNPLGTRYLTIDGLTVMRFSDPGWRTQFDTTSAAVDVRASVKIGTRSIGYGIRVADGLNCTVKNCTIWDAGYHGIMFVGDRCQYNTMKDCVIWGGGTNPTSGISTGGAFYCGSSGSWSHDIIGCVAARVVLRKYTLLGVDGDPILYPFGGANGDTSITIPGTPTTCTCDGFISHTDGAASNDVRDVEYRDCIVYETGKLSDNTMCLGNPFVGGNSGMDPTNPLDWRTYPVRFVRCKAYNIARNRTSGSTSVAWVDCRFQLDRHGVSGDTSGALGSTSGGTLSAGGAALQALLYVGCEIVSTMDNAAASARILWQCHSANDVYVINCSVLGTGTGTNTKQFVNLTAGLKSVANGSTVQSYFYARRSIFAYASNIGGTAQFATTGFGPQTTPFSDYPTNTVPYTDGTGLNQTNMDVEDCEFSGIPSGVMIGFPGPNTFAKWQLTWDGVGFDQTGVSNSTLPFTDSTGASLAPIAAVKARKAVTLSVVPFTGFNGLQDSHIRGAYQYGSGVNRINRLGRISRLGRV